MRFRWIVLIGLVAASFLIATTLRDREPERSEFCEADVGTVSVQLDLEQAQWVSLMSAIAQRRGLPPRATSIAIATAFQESKVHNLDYGDRDSVGLFQQRPSQGWGTAQQILDPHYAINAFYDALVKIKGYTSMEITEAAQKVQRSAAPGAYAQHEAYSRALASALRGYSPAKFTCQINSDGSGSVTALTKDVKKAFGDIAVATHGDDIAYPLTGRAPDVRARGWALAHYLVANAKHLKIQTISFGDREWTAEHSDRGWVARTPTDHDTVRASMN